MLKCGDLLGASTCQKPALLQTLLKILRGNPRVSKAIFLWRLSNFNCFENIQDLFLLSIWFVSATAAFTFNIQRFFFGYKLAIVGILISQPCARCLDTYIGSAVR